MLCVNPVREFRSTTSSKLDVCSIQSIIFSRFRVLSSCWPFLSRPSYWKITDEV